MLIDRGIVKGPTFVKNTWIQLKKSKEELHIIT